MVPGPGPASKGPIADVGMAPAGVQAAAQQRTSEAALGRLSVLTGPGLVWIWGSSLRRTLAARAAGGGP